MDSRLNYANISKQAILDYMAFYEQGGVTSFRPVFDEQRQRYVLVDIRWREDVQCYTVPLHLEIVEGKIWIEHDDTEEGIATDLLEAGVPKEDIVLGFHPQELRPYTEFGVGKAQIAAVPADAPASLLSQAA